MKISCYSSVKKMLRRTFHISESLYLFITKISIFHIYNTAMEFDIIFFSLNACKRMTYAFQNCPNVWLKNSAEFDSKPYPIGRRNHWPIRSSICVNATPSSISSRSINPIWLFCWPVQAYSWRMKNSHDQLPKRETDFFEQRNKS